MTTVLYGALLAASAVSPSPAPARRPAPGTAWVWPVQPPVVTRPFDPPPTPYAAGHRGIDLAAVAGQPVEAAGAGVVSFAGQVAGIGVVVIRHDGGLRTTYEPVDPAVTAGQSVTGGAVVGHVTGGHQGCTVCLHFGLREGETYLDPMLLFARGPVRLVPVDGPPALAVPASGATSPHLAVPSATARGAHLSLAPALSPDAAAGLAITGAAVTGAGAAVVRRAKRRAPAAAAQSKER